MFCKKGARGGGWVGLEAAGWLSAWWLTPSPHPGVELFFNKANHCMGHGGREAPQAQNSRGLDPSSNPGSGALRLLKSPTRGIRPPTLEALDTNGTFLTPRLWVNRKDHLSICNSTHPTQHPTNSVPVTPFCRLPNQTLRRLHIGLLITDPVAGRDTPWARGIWAH